MMLPVIPTRWKVAIAIGCIIIAMAGYGTYLAGRLDNEKAKVVRLSQDREAVLQGSERYRTKEGKAASEVLRLTLEVEELKAQRGEVYATLKDMKAKYARLQSVSRAVTVVSDTIRVRMVDTVYLQRPAKRFVYSDGYMAMQGVVQGDDVVVSYAITDSITQSIERVPKRFLGIPFGIKAVKQRVSCKNPSATITYSEYIEIE